jgi:hypothetical protein
MTNVRRRTAVPFAGPPLSPSGAAARVAQAMSPPPSRPPDASTCEVGQHRAWAERRSA